MHDEIGATVRPGDLVLADGGVETRVMFDDALPIDPHVDLVMSTS
jgi:hypothetical protein